MVDPDNNCWVLGGTGFVGTALVEQFTMDANYTLHMLVNKRVASPQLEQYNCIQGDLGSLDLKWFERYPPQVLFHLARIAGSNPIRRKLAARKGKRANQRLIKYFLKQENRPTTVYVSGSLVYGNQEGKTNADEKSEINPLAYARAYIQAEKPWMNQLNDLSMHVKIARPGWIIGPGSWFRRFFWNHYERFGTVPVYGSGNQLMSLIHIEDLARALVMMPDQGNAINNLFVGQPIPQSQFTKLMADLLGCGIQIITQSEIQRKWGHAEAEALCSSIPMSTNHPAFLDQVDFQYQSPESMLERTLFVLKSK